MKRWVGFGVIADNLINMGRILAAQLETMRNADENRDRLIGFPQQLVPRAEADPNRHFCAGKELAHFIRVRSVEFF